MARAKLRVPSLQQVIKNLNEKPSLVQKSLVRSALNRPTISYRLLHKATQSICWNEPLSQIEDVIRRAEKRVGHRDNLLELVQLIAGHFSTVFPDYPPIEVECRYYQISPGLRVPFQPPICYGIGGQLYLPYFNYWRRSPLKGKRLSIFMTVLDEIRRQEPDIENARMPILDFSIPTGENKRGLIVLSDDEVERVSKEELKHWMQIFAEGYRAAQLELAELHVTSAKFDDANERQADEQDDLFRWK